MKAAPSFAPYPRASAPVYKRWLLVGVVLFAACFMHGWLRSRTPEQLSVAEARDAMGMTIQLILALMLWLLAFLLRMLFYSFNRHNAFRYEQAAEQALQTWWQQHRQRAALLECVLLGPACSTALQQRSLFSMNHEPPPARNTAQGPVLRVMQLVSEDAKREPELATLLVINWKEQHPTPAVQQPVRCYWQGSADAWAAFAAQTAISFPEVLLPAHPEPWQGQASLEEIIDLLHESPTEARVLCAGCESSAAQADSTLPAGEAAVLWVLGRQGAVQIARGEWLVPDQDDAHEVAARGLLQSGLAAPPDSWVSFAGAELQGTGWTGRQYPQDANFGALITLHGMVAQTMAALWVQTHEAPCAWLAPDPVHPLCLGVVRPDDKI